MENSYIPEIYVGENGNWFVNGYDTGTKAQGENGKDGITPHIGANGNWFIGDTDTLVPATGPKGEKGDKGDRGEPGPAGLQGLQGVQGPQGLTGPQGPTGATGPQGATGPKGDTGVQGPQGPQGVQGPQGLTGATGPKGEKGDKGDRGEPGPVNIANNLETTEEGYALDARQGKVLDDAIRTLDNDLPLVQSGQGIYPVPAGNYRTVTITFAKPFKNIPNVVACVRGTSYSNLFNVTIASISATQVSLYLRNHNTANYDMPYQWIAVGQR